MASAGGAYASRFYQRDLALQSVLRKRRDASSQRTVLLHQDVADICAPAYRAACYDDVGTAQRFAVFRPGEPRQSWQLPGRFHYTPANVIVCPRSAPCACVISKCSMRSCEPAP